MSIIMTWFQRKLVIVFEIKMVHNQISNVKITIIGFKSNLISVELENYINW